MKNSPSNFNDREEEEIQHWRQSQFPWLSENSLYLDHAGAPLFPRILIESSTSDILSTLPSNPHSNKEQKKRIDLIRDATLRFFGASPEKFSLVWCSGATGALRLLGEQFRWNHGSIYGYCTNNHTSLVGIREYSLAYGGNVFAFDALDGLSCEFGERQRISSSDYVKSKIDEYKQKGRRRETIPYDNKEEKNELNVAFVGPHLLGIAAESNFDGTRINLSCLSEVGRQGKRQFTEIGNSDEDNGITNFKSTSKTHNNNDQRNKNFPIRYSIVLDAAKLAGSDLLNLEDKDFDAIDFVAVSMYKIFGFPTGLGALIIRHSALPLLIESSDQLNQKQIYKYFGGGSVDLWSPESDFVVRKSVIHERFEFGTLNTMVGTAFYRHTVLLFCKQAILSLPRCFQYSFNTTSQSLLQQFTRYSLFQLVQSCRTQYSHLIERLRRLTNYLVDRLTNLQYRTTNFRCVRLLGHHVPTPCDLQKKGSSFSSVFSDPGPIVSFICFTANGNIIPHSIIQRVADSYNVYLRTGCFCNMGGCIEGLLLSDQDIRLMYKDGHVCGDDIGMVGNMPTGCCRISLGVYHSTQDVDRFIDFLVKRILSIFSRPINLRPILLGGDTQIKRFLRSSDFVSQQLICRDSYKQSQIEFPFLSSIWIYPVKGCRGINLDRWIIPMKTSRISQSFLFDRLFRIDSSTSLIHNTTRSLTSQLRSQLVDIATGILFITFPLNKNDFLSPQFYINDVYIVILPYHSQSNYPLLMNVKMSNSIKFHLNSKVFQSRVLIPSQLHRIHLTSNLAVDKDSLQPTRIEKAQQILNQSASRFAISNSSRVIGPEWNGSKERGELNERVWVVSKNDFDDENIRSMFVISSGNDDSFKIENDWWSTVLNKAVSIRSAAEDEERENQKQDAIDKSNKSSFANTHDFMIANEATLNDFLKSIGMAIDIERFRPNVVVGGVKPNTERTWSKLMFTDLLTGLTSSVIKIDEPCYRCPAVDVFRRTETIESDQLIDCINSLSSSVDKIPVLSLLASHTVLSSTSRQSHRPVFGMLGSISSPEMTPSFHHNESSIILCCGDAISFSIS